MNWKKIVEQTVTLILSMVLTGVGTAIGYTVVTVMQHERDLAKKDAQILMLQEALKHTKQRDEELISMMAEEIKKLKLAVEESCAHVAGEVSKPAFPVRPLPDPQPEKDPKKVFDKFFPPEQRTDDYQRILRDKFKQRTDNMEQRQAP